MRARNHSGVKSVLLDRVPEAGRILLLIAVCVSVLVLFVVPLRLDEGPVLHELHNAAHVIVFALLAPAILLIAVSFRADADLRFAHIYLGAWLTAVFIGLLIEGVQSLAARDATWSDVRGDAAGALCGLLILSAFRESSRRLLWRYAAIAVAVILLVVACWPFWRQVTAYLESQRQWPVLLSADQRHVLLNVDQSTARLARGPGHWDILFSGDPLSGVTFNGWPRTWRDQRALVLDLANGSDAALIVGLVIRDGSDNKSYANRYNAEFALDARTRRTIEIPLSELARAPNGRLLDLNDVRAVTVFRAAGAADSLSIVGITLR